MEVIDFLKSEEFLRIKKLMGISDEDTRSFTLEISADDPNLKISGDGIFYGKNRKILYIRDQAQYGEKKSNYKFHIAGCQTLSLMRNSNRDGKYVVSEETTGIFKVNRIINNDKVEVEEKLHVCKHCLRSLNWKGYNSADINLKNFIYENFSIEEFFKVMSDDNSGLFDYIPVDNEITARLNVYPSNWDEISRRMKAKYHYTCQECGKIIFKPGGLHVHHKNALKWDCRESNLVVLCTDCHQAKHNHKIKK